MHKTLFISSIRLSTFGCNNRAFNSQACRPTSLVNVIRQDTTTCTWTQSAMCHDDNRHRVYFLKKTQTGKKLQETFPRKHATSQNKKRATMSCTFNALLLVLDTFGNVPSCVKVESTERVKVPGSVDDGAENSIVGIWQRPIFVIYEVVESGLCRLQNLQRCYSLRHLWLSYNKRVKSTHCVSILVLR